MTYDVLIKNGTIVDGTGKPMYKADIGIKDDRIKEIGDLNDESAENTVDAKGMLVSPGFIDVNNHSDTYWRIFSGPNLESLLYQGVTTIVGGNCGSSLAPLADKEIIKSIQKWMDVSKVNFNWLSTKEFLAEVEGKGISTNFATLIGHSTLRRGFLRDEVRDPSHSELRGMEKMLAGAMKEGAIGFSTGLVYTHAKKASQEEIMGLAAVVKKYDGVYATHIRGEAEELLEAVEEAIRIAKKTGVRIQISHLKAMGRKHWHLMDEAISLIETAKMDGLDINFDVYPYTATGSVLYILLPDWVAEGGKNIMLKRLKDPGIRERVIKEMKEDSFEYDKVIISMSPLNKNLKKKSIAEIAKSQDKGLEETVLDILIASEGRVITLMDILSEKNVENAIQNPFSIISSNGSGYSIDYRDTGELTHPRNFGSFPRVLSRYVRSKGVLSWEEAIRKMSGLPAEKFRIKDRGVISEEKFADLVVLDPKEIRDKATTEDPFQYSVGIRHVLVNGKFVIKNEKHTQALPGSVLRSTARSFFGF